MSKRFASLATTMLWSLVLCSSWLGSSAVAQDSPPTATPPDTTATPDAAAQPEQPAPDSDAPRRYRREVVSFGKNAYLGKDEAADSVVAIGGNATSEGEVRDAVVAVFGKTHVTGEVDNSVVAVFGDTYVDGRVGGEVVAVFGDVTLGPNAVVERQVSAVFGTVNSDPAAKIDGDIHEVSLPWKTSAVFTPWFKQGLLFGRPLAFEPGFGWAWRLAGFFLFVYVVIGLLFPRQLTTAAEVFEQRPGEIVLAGFLAMVLTPLIFLVVISTGVGILLIPFMCLGMLLGMLFGKAAVFATIGRRITRLFGEGPLSHVAVAVAIGGALAACVYAVPALGFLAMMSVGLLGLGVFAFIVVTLLRSWQVRRNAARGGDGRGADASGVDLSKPQVATPPLDPTPGASMEGTPPQHAMDADGLLALPRAGFWIRMAALFVDVILVLVVVNMGADEDLVPVALAGYGALMWKLKGTTIGGTLCNLQVVRVDGRELDWATVIVRALGCFLSLIFAGLGFIWIGFDRERQAWHDKIAGTVVVRTAKTVALV